MLVNGPRKYPIGHVLSVHCHVYTIDRLLVILGILFHSFTLYCISLYSLLLFDYVFLGGLDIT